MAAILEEKRRWAEKKEMKRRAEKAVPERKGRGEHKVQRDAGGEMLRIE